MYLNEIDKKLSEVQQLSESIEPFAVLQENLLSGPVSEISIREIKAVKILTELRAIREDLEREVRPYNRPQQSQPSVAGTVKPCGFSSPCAQRYAFSHKTSGIRSNT